MVSQSCSVGVKSALLTVSMPIWSYRDGGRLHVVSPYTTRFVRETGFSGHIRTILNRHHDLPDGLRLRLHTRRIQWRHESPRRRNGLHGITSNHSRGLGYPSGETFRTFGRGDREISRARTCQADRSEPDARYVCQGSNAEPRGL